MHIDTSEILFIIPARGGSKRLPNKNIKLLAGKPLIYYSIDIARTIVNDKNICVTTDSDEIISVVEKYGLPILFKRPEALASDTATTYEVLVHAVNFYRQLGRNFKFIVLLQVTSPLRRKRDIENAINLVDDSCDMVVSVCKSHAASVMCHEDEDGYLIPTLKKDYGRSQDFNGEFYEYNGSIYVMKVSSILQKNMNVFKRKKYVMPNIYSTDIDTEEDFVETSVRLEYLKSINKL